MRLQTPRGAYELRFSDERREGDALVLTLSFERLDGIEKLAIKCRITGALLRARDGTGQVAEAQAKLGPWLEREFEQTREAALKMIRTERRLLEIVFDDNNAGPFESHDT